MNVSESHYQEFLFVRFMLEWNAYHKCLPVARNFGKFWWNLVSFDWCSCLSLWFGTLQYSAIKVLLLNIFKISLIFFSFSNILNIFLKLSMFFSCRDQSGNGSMVVVSLMSGSCCSTLELNRKDDPILNVSRLTHRYPQHYRRFNEGLHYFTKKLIFLSFGT